MLGKDAFVLRATLLLVVAVLALALVTLGQVRGTRRDIERYPRQHGSPAETQAEVKRVAARVEQIGVRLERIERKAESMVKLMRARHRGEGA